MGDIHGAEMGRMLSRKQSFDLIEKKGVINDKKTEPKSFVYCLVFIRVFFTLLSISFFYTFILLNLFKNNFNKRNGYY